MARYFGTNIISKDISGLTSSQYAAINSTITKAKVDDMVTLTTAQNISGKKNFTNDVNITKSIPSLEIKDSNSSADLTLTSRSTAHSGARVRLMDSKGKKVTSIYNTYSTTGDVYTRIQHNSKSGKMVELSLGFDVNEVGIATAPTPTSTTNKESTQIATTGWVNKKGNNVVHILDDEDINSSKTFQKELNIQDTVMDETVAPSSVLIKDICILDKNRKQIGRFGIRQENTKQHSTEMVTQKTVAATNGFYKAFFKNSINESGQCWLEFTPGVEKADTNNSTEPPITNLSATKVSSSSTEPTIPTMGWVNNSAASTNVVHRSGTETISGAKTFSSTIASSITTGSYLAGNKGTAIINSTAGAGNYTMLAKMNTTNGYMTLGTYQGRCELHYTAKTTVDAGTNSYTYQVTLLDESGNAQFPNQITCPTFSGTATKAKWADLAENYVSDKIYPIGTLIKFGGEADITIADDNCNGAISDKPGYLLDAELEGGQPVALVGKTPIRIIGKINKHDKVTLSEIPGVGRVATEGEKVIARALESSDNDDEKLIMCVTKFNLD